MGSNSRYLQHRLMMGVVRARVISLDMVVWLIMTNLEFKHFLINLYILRCI